MDATDFLLNPTGDLATEDGDLVVGLSDNQHIELLLRTNPGDWKLNPLVGVGFYKNINAPFSPITANIQKKEIALQLEMDGYVDVNIQVKSLENVNINATR